MFGIDRRAARAAWTVMLIILLLGLVYVLRKTLFVFVVAVLFAYLLAPLVNLLDRWLPASRTRTPALAIAYIIFVGVAAGIGIQVGSRVVEQANTLAKDFPTMLERWQTPTPGAAPWLNQIKQEAVGRARTAITERAADLVSALPAAGLKFLTVASDLIYVVVIPILAFFFLKDGREIRRTLLDLASPGIQRAFLDGLLADIDALLVHYMRALVLLSAATFVAYSVFFSILGIPYAVLLSALGGVLEFIPMVGPLAAGASVVVVALVSGDHALWVLVFLLAYRLFQDYILGPYLMGQGVEVHPVLVLFGVFAGAEIAGIAGTFLSVPVLALGRILYLRIRKARSSEPVGAAELE